MNHPAAGRATFHGFLDRSGSRPLSERMLAASRSFLAMTARYRDRLGLSCRSAGMRQRRI